MVTHFLEVKRLRQLWDSVIARVHRPLRFEVTSWHLVFAKNIKRRWISFLFIVLMIMLLLSHHFVSMWWNFLLVKVRLLVEFIFILNRIFMVVLFEHHGALNISAVVVLGNKLVGLENLLCPLVIFFSEFNFVLGIASRSVSKTSTLVFINECSLLCFELIFVQSDLSYLSGPNQLLLGSACLGILVSDLSTCSSIFIRLRHTSGWRLVHKWLNGVRTCFQIGLCASPLGQISSVSLHGRAWRILLFLITHIFFI